jgi:two-component system nitrogen regulation response regulator NtrX
VVPLFVPPLRERREDIPLLVNHFLARCRAEDNLPPRRFSKDALDALRKLSWPGNVRELGNIVERLVILTRGAEIGTEELDAAGLPVPGSAANGSGPEDVGSKAVAGPGRVTGGFRPEEVLALGGLVEARRAFEIACIVEGLRAAAGNVSEAARLLGIDRTNLHKKIQAYGIEVERRNHDETVS